ncbi:MAG: hypothetical protein HC780_22380 [Leptolyngbyaceae cyanobacterium CSU_1_3]|nr:hypothetical protein [Leptolyngbyaceae cyanobacterium CSU_1_3]
MSSLPALRKPSRRKNLWFERLMAIAATANLALVAFDLSYIPWRDFWLRRVTILPITQWYDPIKGIEPHRDTQQYLESVDLLTQELSTRGLQSNQVQQQLQELRDRSAEMVQNNPFQVANKSGTFEKIKNRMRERVFGQRQGASARIAFETFWSRDYLTQRGVEDELQFFDRDIRPLLSTNYYRTIGENGEFTDRFWRIDSPFVILFGLEFLARSFYLSRRYQSLSWLDAMLWRWYDVFLLIPFWRWLRVIPVALRLEQAGLLSWERVRTQASQGFIANISEELAEVVVVQVIDRIQTSIRQGEFARWVAQTAARPYVDINQRDEIQELTSHILKLTVYSVLPKVKPDLEALLRHNVEAILSQSPAYQTLKMVPLVGDVPRQMNERLITEITEGAYGAIVAALEDKVGAELLSKLIKKFGESLVTEVQDQRSLQELQSLATDLLEEIKINYVKRFSSDEVEGVLEETRQIRWVDRG